MFNLRNVSPSAMVLVCLSSGGLGWAGGELGWGVLLSYLGGDRKVQLFIPRSLGSH